MEHVDPISVVENYEKLTALFGGWPSFHDAEVTDLALWRGDVRPDEKVYTFPVLTAKVLVQELVKNPNADHGLLLLPRAEVTLRFRDVFELKLDDFNHTNMIFGLSFSLLPRGHYTNGEPLPPYIFVEFERGFGLLASFKCFGVEVVSATSCTANAA
jgi:Immunity protein 50